MKYLKIFALFITICLLIACNKSKSENKYSNIPSLRFISQNLETIHYMDSSVVLNLKFEFTDGDGDIARLNESSDSSIIVLVMRELDTTNTRYVFPMPMIGSNYFQKNGGIKASLDLDLANYFFYPRSDSAHISGLDTMRLGIYIQDYSGNKSDTVIIGPLYLEP